MPNMDHHRLNDILISDLQRGMNEHLEDVS